MPHVFLQYQNNSPVSILTQTFPSLLHGEEPTVGDLIAAYKTAVAPLFDSTPIDELTLHFRTSNGVEINYNSWDPLTVLGDNGRLGATPLVIRSLNDTITMDEYMVFPLPQPVYDTGYFPSVIHWKARARVQHWTDFKQNALEWIHNNHQQHLKRIKQPVFFSRVITEEVQTLQPFIFDNLLSVSAKCFIPTSEFKARRQISACVGEPDHLFTRNGEIVALVEEKGNWTLSTEDLVNSYSTFRACASAVNQLYHYMRLNHRKYGILTSYENTWFVYRSQECIHCEGPQRHETLYVSEAISFTTQSPSIQQCFAYFNTICDSIHMESPPTSRRPSRTNSVTNISRPSIPRICPLSIALRSGYPLTPEVAQLIDQAQDFDVDDFKLDAVIGEGRSKVYLGYYDSNSIALKIADIAKRPEMLPELLNEVSVYEQLSALQGNGIPRFICHGFVEQILYCVGVSICGTVPKAFDQHQKQKLIETLQTIHDFGILHNDIKKENILIDESGNPYIIDFGFSSRDSCPDAQMEERKILLSVIESNQTSRETLFEKEEDRPKIDRNCT